jgi:hypothetical protein
MKSMEQILILLLIGFITSNINAWSGHIARQKCNIHHSMSVSASANSELKLSLLGKAKQFITNRFKRKSNIKRTDSELKNGIANFYDEVSSRLYFSSHF